MKKTRKPVKPVSAEAIARQADRGQDVSHFFQGEGRMVQPIQRVNVDVTATMLEGRRGIAPETDRHRLDERPDRSRCEPGPPGS